MSDPVLAWCEDIHLVRGNVSQLQATLNQLVTKTPTVRQYRELLNTYGSPEADLTTEAPHILEKLRSIMHSPQVKVAVRLKSLYDKGYLPFLLGLSRINFRSPKNDRFVGYVLDYVPPKIDGSELFPEDEDFIKNMNADPENVFYPPTLPPIENELLLHLIFTDKSLRQPADFLELEYAEGFHDYNNNHNRKLMLRGRDILNLALTDILDESFPKVHEDDLEYLKLRLTSTSILAKMAFCYNFSDSIMHQIPQETPLEEKLIVFKNVFLAYIGGMSKLRYSFLAIKLWINGLYGPMISRLQLDEYKTQFKSLQDLAYNELNFMLRRINSLTEEPTRRIKHDYKPLETEGPFVCQLIISNEEFGIGTGSNMEKARQKAAYETLETPELRSKLMAILIQQFRKPQRHKVSTTEGPPTVTKESVSDDDAYSPGLSPAEADTKDPPPLTNAPTQSQKPPAAFVPQVNYGGWSLPAVSLPPTNGKGAGNSEGEQSQQPKVYPAAQAPTSQPHARMPLPYGKLPPIPNMKKKGGKI